MQKLISIVIISTIEERRALIRRYVCESQNALLAGEIADPGALALVAHLQPDVVVIDCASPSLNVLAILPWLQQLPHAPRVVALGAIGSISERRLLLELGAVAYASFDTPASIPQALGLASQLTMLRGRPARSMARAF